MKLTRLRVFLISSLAAAVVGAGLHAPPALAVDPTPAPTATASEEPGLELEIPELVTESWNGTTGVDTMAERWRKAVADVAEFTAEQEVRDAALAALATGDPATIQKFATVDKPALDKQVAARKKQEAANNLATIKALKGTGGPYFNAEVERVLAGTDSDRAAFLAYGADIARDRDKKTSDDAAERAAMLRERVRLIAAMAPAESNVRRAAEAAFAGDDNAVNAFLNGGYLTAARADAAEREQYLKDLEARNKAVEELTELAQKSARASEARRRLLIAHGEGVRALQQASNAMAAAANGARHSARVLAGSGTATAKAPELASANTEVKRQLGHAQVAAREAGIAAQTASTAADEIVATGLDYGAEWAQIAQGMSEAATAAFGAAQTAVFASDATIATNNAQGAQAQAEAHAQQAVKWREHAEEHAKSAAKLAAAAAKQASAAKTAAARAKKAREQAQAAEAKAWAEAEKTRQHRQEAEAQAAEAKRQRQIAQQEAALAARYRAQAEREAAAARAARANAEAQAAIADGAAKRAEDADRTAATASDNAWAKENTAREARDAAYAAERNRQTAEARAQAMRAMVAKTDSAAERDAAQAAANQADGEFRTADTAAKSARGYANTASGAAANARSAATQAQQAANRAWAAAERAREAAAAADAAADRAEASAKATHAARVRADAKAAVATAQQAKAAQAANTAVSLASQAADQAVRALWAADRTKAEAEAATTEAVAAAAQADIAIRAASAAAASSAGIADPYDTALSMVSPFTGADIDADFVESVAEEARIIGAEQAAAAQARADEAVIAATKAQQAADRANAQVKPAYVAAAQAAHSSAEAARSAAEAKKYAAQAAVDGAAARAAAASAGRADAQARADALAARQAANEAANDAAIASRSAQQAQADANAADSAASAAEADAAAANSAADRAEASARDAKASAESAQRYADSAAEAASRALEHAVAAEQAAERAEAAERERLDKALEEGADLTPEQEQELLDEMTPEERAEYEAAKKAADQGIVDFIKEHGLEFLGDLILGDLKECATKPSFGACFWAVIDVLPWGKLKKLGNLWDFYKKFEKFTDGVRKAGKKADEILKKAKDKLLRKSKCPGNSFAAGTPVLMADGTTRAIDRLALGDRVLATDPFTGVTAAEPVIARIVGSGDKKLVDLTIGGATITATHNHPFWVPALFEWVDAESLTAGQWLRTSSGTLVQISAVSHRAETSTVYNLTVADVHTYYVVAEAAAVLVHNATPCPKPGDPDFDSAEHYGELGDDFKPGVVDPHNRLEDKERAIAERLEREGEAVFPRKRVDDVQGHKNPDVMVRRGPNDPGVIIEFKTLNSGSTSAVKRNILSAGKQVEGAKGEMVIDGRNVGLTAETAREGFKRAAGQARAHGQAIPSKIRVILADDTIIELS
ncbi:polymorphic toxin-type HINT domain-containing protein [Actinoplanes sp. NPDC026670]|uniref:polymorphic toxin-type HINT domain-containing protein n=1 Tax=Actinoplanes sp. NPDC026670 TaxID=3154700 RepID=UPI0033EA9939